MRSNTEWVVVDTETSGLMPPVYAVEIAAQRMRGWEPAGTPFQVLLNHDVPIDPAAEALHGYSQGFLRKNGRDPIQAHAAFREYAGDLPFVSFNLSFDWNRVLSPEYDRLGIPATGSAGFCALLLSRRCIHETPNYRLETLKSHFDLSHFPSHKGLYDVKTLGALLGRVIRPRLESCGVNEFDEIAAFSRKTPVAACLKRITGQAKFPAEKTPPSQVVIKPPASVPVQPPKAEHLDSISELLGFCEGIIADNQINNEEFAALGVWLMKCPNINVHPISDVADAVEHILEDGQVTAEELGGLLDMLRRLVAAPR